MNPEPPPIRLTVEQRPEGWFIVGPSHVNGPFHSRADTVQMAQDMAAYIRVSGGNVELVAPA